MTGRCVLMAGDLGADAGRATLLLGSGARFPGRTIEHWEQGRRMPAVESLYVMAGLLASPK